MKIRVKMPEEIARNDEACKYFVDEVLLWGLETEMDIAFYTWYRDPTDNWNSKNRWAVFNVEADYSYMFSLKWGATLHKPKEKNREIHSGN